MKKLIFTFILLFSILSFGQKANQIKKKTHISKVSSINFSFHTAQEIETIDWNDLKSMFDENKEEDLIEIGFSLNLKKSKNNLRSSFRVGGLTKNIDSLLLVAKKGTSNLKRIATKYSKK